MFFSYCWITTTEILNFYKENNNFLQNPRNGRFHREITKITKKIRVFCYFNKKPWFFLLFLTDYRKSLIFLRKSIFFCSFLDHIFASKNHWRNPSMIFLSSLKSTELLGSSQVTKTLVFLRKIKDFHQFSEVSK